MRTTDDPVHFPDNAFGDPFDLASLPLRRPAAGYAVQMLATDTLLDRERGEFMPVRTPTLRALHDDFASAHAAAARWVREHCRSADEHRLAIVPASYDHELGRHILIYGVLNDKP